MLRKGQTLAKFPLPQPPKPNRAFTGELALSFSALPWWGLAMIIRQSVFVSFRLLMYSDMEIFRIFMDLPRKKGFFPAGSYSRWMITAVGSARKEFLINIPRVRISCGGPTSNISPDTMIQERRWCFLLNKKRHQIVSRSKILFSIYMQFFLSFLPQTWGRAGLLCPFSAILCFHLFLLSLKSL